MSQNGGHLLYHKVRLFVWSALRTADLEVCFQQAMRRNFGMPDPEGRVVALASLQLYATHFIMFSVAVTYIQTSARL